MNLKYYVGALFSLPLLPIMYYQGIKIRASVPTLPEATGTAGKVNANLKTEQSIRLVTIGESTIAGVGVATHEEGFTGTLAKELSRLLQVNIDWKVYARSGYTAADVSKEIVRNIDEEKIELIVIGLGGNDAFTLNSPKKWRKDIRNLIEGLRSTYPKSPIIFCNMPPIKEFPAFTALIRFTIGNLVELLGQELSTLVKEYENVYYFGERITFEGWIDAFQLDANKSAFFSDGVHPSKLTYQIWAKDIASRISNSIRHISLFMLLLTMLAPSAWSQAIPDQKVLEITELENYLKTDTRTKLQASGEITPARLAQYWREQFSERFFYNHTSFDERLAIYNELYSNQAAHKARALDHLTKYPDSTQWLLPFDYQNGEAVNAYALRHLARQHKMVDIALYYFDQDKDPQYIHYFVNQMQSLNAALASGAYEKIEDGNGVYEVFRSGYRIFNWLWIHNMFLSEEAYGDAAQLQTITTLLQHGQHLYERNAQFRSGNHQTRGMSALAVLSMLFPNVKGTDKWYDRAMLRLSEHLDKEINPDGFQFERSVHYHMSDINNYFYVYQLANINQIDVDKAWEKKLQTLFVTLTKIAYPDRTAPVLQDDTDDPWAEKNDISGAMTLGYLLFDDPEFGYFATDKVEEKMYWHLSLAQVKQLRNVEQKRPSYGSLAFEDTDYYIMREGWSPDDKMMVVSAGLDPDKPDHQHGDMLGIQAMANGQVILPNYQVRYSLTDFDLFKNSMVKNVALVDDELQGKQWTSNKGGSGFGKFKQLPQPTVIAWESNPAFDLFIGSHDGFEKKGVNYSRQVIYVKDAFWIVKDNFKSETSHDYKQVWQGHYTQESGPHLIRSSFADASGCDILQLNPVDTAITSGARGKNWTVISKTKQSTFDFLTVIFPYKGYNKRIDETQQQLTDGAWAVNDARWELTGSHPTVISKQEEFYFFGVKELKRNDVRIELSAESDLYVARKENSLEVYLLGEVEVSLSLYQGARENNKIAKQLEPGANAVFILD